MSKIRSKSFYNEVDKYKYSPLHIATKFGHLKLVKKLIKAGSDPNALCLCNYAPVHFLARLSPDPKNQKSVNAYVKVFKVNFYFISNFLVLFIVIFVLFL